jgi:hypothetical protein
MKEITIATARGDARPLTQDDRRVSTDIAYGGDGPSWFGPLQPQGPLAPPEVGGRAIDFPAGVNLQQRPKTEPESIGFEVLRTLAESCDLVRIVTSGARIRWRG